MKSNVTRSSKLFEHWYEKFNGSQRRIKVGMKNLKILIIIGLEISIIQIDLHFWLNGPCMENLPYDEKIMPVMSQLGENTPSSNKETGGMGGLPVNFTPVFI